MLSWERIFTEHGADISYAEFKQIYDSKGVTISEQLYNNYLSVYLKHLDTGVPCTELLDANIQKKIHESSAGLGDTVAKITAATGLDKLAKIYTQVTGKDCGCKSRQEALNKLVPYGVKEEISK